MNQEELLNGYDAIKESIDSAPESPTPFPVVKDEKLSVVGDANETQLNKHDFKLLFRFPEGVTGGKKVEGGVLTEIEYKDVFITPRQSGKVIASMCRMLPYFRKLVETADGMEAEGFTRDEIVEILAEFGDDFVDAMYDLVQKALQIDPKLIDYLEQRSAMDATYKIITEYPEIVNEAEAFFS